MPAEKMKRGITRSAGINTGYGFITGGGYTGETKELDDAVVHESEMLREAFHKPVEIRFNSDRHSGGAFIKTKDGGSIGLNSGLRPKLPEGKTHMMLMNEFYAGTTPGTDSAWAAGRKLDDYVHSLPREQYYQVVVDDKYLKDKDEALRSAPAENEVDDYKGFISFNVRSSREGLDWLKANVKRSSL